MASVTAAFREIASVMVHDGIVFDPDSITATEIRKEAGYGGVRVTIAAELAKARCKTQIDVGFGDAVTLAPVVSMYPRLLPELPAPQLRAYTVYTVIAEKLHAIALLGVTNSRLKDYFDLAVVLERETLDDKVLGEAIKNTFERRGMTVPNQPPTGLSEEFANDLSRQVLWRAFQKRNQLTLAPLSLTVSSIREGLEPALKIANGLA